MSDRPWIIEDEDINSGGICKIIGAKPGSSWDAACLLYVYGGGGGTSSSDKSINMSNGLALNEEGIIRVMDMLTEALCRHRDGQS